MKLCSRGLWIKNIIFIVLHTNFMGPYLPTAIIPILNLECHHKKPIVYAQILPKICSKPMFGTL